jgi:peptidyl-prolyl cis-trans isomerase SurA
MKRSIILVIVLISLIAVISGCTRHHSETVVALIGDSPLTLSEYEATYARLNGGWEKGRDATLDERKEFLDLLVRFKLKMNDAYDSGLDNSPTVLEELEEYRKSLAVAFLLEREFFEPALREMYDRRTEEFRASHILLRLPPDPSPEDTLGVYSKAMELINMLQTGAVFEDLATQFSEDPSAAQNNGDLYYFSGGVMVKPFEDAVWNLQPGEITQKPVRTQFGYHIIKVVDRRRSGAGVRASHIMKYAQPDAAPEDTLRAFEEIHELLDSLKTGSDFAELARRHSGDWGSADRGGDLGVFQRRRLPREFEEVAFDLKEQEISDVVRTQFGFHIIKTTEHVPLQSYEDMRDELRRSYQQSRMNTEFKGFIDVLRNKYSFTRNSDSIEQFLSALDTTAITDQDDWIGDFPDDVKNLTLFTVAGRDITGSRVAHHLQTNPEFIGRRLQPSAVREMIGRIEEIELLQVEAEGIESRHPDFAEKVDEYKDGILIYYIEQDRIWSTIDLDEEKLREFYEATIENYTFPDRVNFVEVVVRQDTLAESIYNRVLAGEDIEGLAEQNTVRSGMKRNRGVTGMIEAERDELSRKAFSLQPGEVSEPFKTGNNWAIVKTLEKDPARYKTFEEARAQITGAYQDQMASQREKNWLESLHTRYPVDIFYENLESAFTVKDNS